MSMEVCRSVQSAQLVRAAVLKFPTSSSFFRLPTASPAAPSSHFFSKLTLVKAAESSSSSCLTWEQGFTPVEITVGSLNADGICGVTSSTDLIPAEVENLGSRRGSRGRVTNSYGVPARDSSGEVVVVGVCERDGVVTAAVVMVLRL